MHRTRRQSLFVDCMVLAAFSLGGCATPLPKPPLLTPMPTTGFLLTPLPPPGMAPPQANSSCSESKCL